MYGKHLLVSFIRKFETLGITKIPEKVQLKPAQKHRILTSCKCCESHERTVKRWSKGMMHQNGHRVVRTSDGCRIFAGGAREFPVVSRYNLRRGRESRDSSRSGRRLAREDNVRITREEEKEEEERRKGSRGEEEGRGGEWPSAERNRKETRYTL